MRKIKVHTWGRYYTPNFTVFPEIMGEKHEFEFESYNITISIPSIDLSNRGDGHDQLAILESWTEENGIKVPLEYNILKVDINIEVKELQYIPEKASNTKSVDTSIYDKEERDFLDNVSDRYESIANRAFIYWLEILRWSTNSPLLGIAPPFSNRSGYGT